MNDNASATIRAAIVLAGVGSYGFGAWQHHFGASVWMFIVLFVGILIGDHIGNTR